MRDFREEIGRRVLVCDGAMGTMLYSKGVFVNRCFESLNLTDPDLVGGVHLEYVRAGADVIETNTFGANRIRLAPFGLADRVREVCLAGVRLARAAAGGAVYVAGAIGPLGMRIAPWGRTSAEEAGEYFREQAAALVEGGVDLIVLETFRDVNEMGAAIAAVRGLSGLPVVAQMAIEDHGNALDGTAPEAFGPELVRRGADVVGVNCGVGPAPMLETIERIAAATDAPLSAQPNAGLPRRIEGRTLYLSSPEYMASYARRFVARGVRLVGGCCGTTPEHIRHIRLAVESGAEEPRAAGTRAGTAAAGEAAAAPVPPDERSRLAYAMAHGAFVTIVEMAPPRGDDCAATVDAARALKIRGVDAVDVSDDPLASARMSAISTAVLIEQRAGIETVLHYACRGRNLPGMASDLLGAHALGIRNVLLVTGDPPRRGDDAPAPGVYDVDSIGLTHVVGRLNRGVDAGGDTLARPTAYHVGVAVNPTALDPEEEVRRFAAKVEAGAGFAITQAVFDPKALDAFLKRIEPFGVPVVVGVWPFDSAQNAEFMANEVPGVRVPAEVLRRMRRAGTPREAEAEGVAIAREVAAAVRDRVRGVHVAHTSGRVHVALEVIAGLR